LGYDDATGAGRRMRAAGPAVFPGSNPRLQVKMRRWRADMVNVSQSRCPHCSALLTRGADWCSLCLTDLRPAPEPEPMTVLMADGSAADGAAEEPTALLTAPSRPRGKHARRPEGAVMEQDTIDAEVADESPTGLAASLLAIREATSLEAAPGGQSGPRLDIDDIDMSVLAGAGSPSVINDWSLKAQTPGAKVGLMVVGVTVVGGVALLLLTIAGLILR
jgi:hypothetical protein